MKGTVKLSPMEMAMRILLVVLACWLGGALACGTLSGTECNATDSTSSCCLKQHPADYEHCGAEAPHTGDRMLGERGTRLDSKTLWKRARARLDVENPAPGQRPGQIHYQEGNETYLYDPVKKEFIGAPQRINDLLSEDPKFAAAVEKALRYLGE